MGWFADVLDPLDLFQSDDQEVINQAVDVSPDLLAGRDQMANAATQFRQNLPYYQQQASNALQEQAANEKQLQEHQIRSHAANRGLLYSGLREGMEAQAGSNIAGALARKRASINESLMDKAYGMDQAAARSSLGVADMQKKAAQQKYKASYEAGQQDPGLLGAFRSAMGGGR